MTMRVAIIGAGSSGLPAIKCCLDENLEPVCFERDGDIGGLWCYKKKAEYGIPSVMKSTIINTSKEMMAYSDFPAPKDFPNFMHNTKVLEYYKLYAKEFNLMKYIHLNTEVVKVRQCADFSSTGRWEVEVKDRLTGETRKEVFDAVMLCTGHHAEKSLPHFEGEEEFEGVKLHSHDYRNVEGFQDKRVVVVGLGNSGGDIAVELAKFGCQVYLSTRRGSWLSPRVVNGGLPFDAALNNRLVNEIRKVCPRNLFNWYFENFFNKLTDHDRYGLRPKHHYDAQHVLVNDEIPNRIASGTLVVKPNVKRLTKTDVEFEDGTIAKDIDIVFYATGYKFGFKYVDHEGLNVKDNEVNFYKYAFPPEIQPPTLAVIGCFQPLGAIMPISEMQSRWFTRILKKELQLPSQEEMYADIKKKREELANRYVQTQRHTMQVDYIPFMDELASICGCMFSWVDLFKQDPALALKMYLGPVTPFQYRLVGHGSWKGAREAIMTSDERVLYPLRGGRTIDSSFLSVEKMILVGIIVLAVLLKFLIL